MGMRFITTDEIDVDALVSTVSSPERGGTAIFLGTVRRGPDDGPVEFIEYTAYEEMWEAEFARILGETEAKWPETRVTAIHRLGRVRLGEASIAIAAAAPHRADALAACNHAI